MMWSAPRALQPGPLLLRACGRDHRRAGELGELHAAHPDAARGAEDQHLLARRNPPVGEHHAARRAVGAGQRRGRFKADAVGDRDELMRLEAAILGQSAMHGLAGQPALDPVYRVAEHAVPHLPSRDAGADRCDLAGDVETHDGRHRDPDPRHAAAGENVVLVERRGTHAQYDITVAGARVGKPILQAQPAPSERSSRPPADSRSKHPSFISAPAARRGPRRGPHPASPDGPR